MQHTREQGMTFLELIFVISIFAIMATIVLFRFGDFNRKATLSNLVQDIALRIVEAQKAAISGLANPNYPNPEDAPTYGVHFDTEQSHNAEFVYFSDIGGVAGNRAYDTAGSCPAAPTFGNECISVTGIATGEYLSAVCYTAPTTGGGSSSFCLSNPATADITFRRPFPDAWLLVSGQPIPVQKVFIEVTSGTDATMKKTIAVTNLGQVWVYDGEASKFGNP